MDGLEKRREGRSTSVGPRTKTRAPAHGEAASWCHRSVRRVTAVSRIRGTRRIREDTQGHDEAANQVQEDTGGAAGIQKDTTAPRFGTGSPRVQIPRPRPKSEFTNVQPLGSINR